MLSELPGILYVTQCLCLSPLCLYAAVIIKHIDAHAREGDRDRNKERKRWERHRYQRSNAYHWRMSIVGNFTGKIF